MLIDEQLAIWLLIQPHFTLPMKVLELAAYTPLEIHIKKFVRLVLQRFPRSVKKKILRPLIF